MPQAQIGFLPHQRRAYYATQKYKITAMTCGTGAGKTWFGADCTNLKAINTPKKPYEQLIYAIAPTFPMWDRTIRIQLNRSLMQMGLIEGVHYERNKTKRTITFKHNNVTIYGVAANVPESMQGGHVVFIWGDECGIYSNESNFVILQRAAQKKAPILFTSTPYRWNWYRDMVWEHDQAKAKGIKTDVYAFSVPSIANPHFPKDEFEKARLTWPDWRFQMYFMGEFTRPMGLIYSCLFDKNSTVWVDDFDVSKKKGWGKYAGLDFGSVHPTAMTWFVEDPKTEISYLHKEYKQGGIDLNILAGVMKSMDRRYRYYADPSGKFNIDGLTNPPYGLDVVKAANDVIPGIDTVIKMANEGKLKIFNSCTELRKEITQYAWQLDKNDQPMEKPIKIFDDLVDSMRYPLYTRVAEPRVAPVYNISDMGREELYKGFEGIV